MLHESRKGWWLVPYYFTLGRWDRKRDVDNILHEVTDSCAMKIHFTVNVLGQKFNCRLRKSYTYFPTERKWMKDLVGNPPSSLREARITILERELLQSWKANVDLWENLEDGDDLNDGDFSWTSFADDMQWKRPQGQVAEDSLILSIDTEIDRRLEEHRQQIQPPVVVV